MTYKGLEKRQYGELSQEEFEKIATRAKELALRDIYIAVGKSVIAKTMWFLGATIAAIAAYFHFNKQ